LLFGIPKESKECVTYYKSASLVKKPVNINQYDSNIWNTALIWHGKISVRDFAVMLKGQCMQESEMNALAMRNELGYLSGKYAKTVNKTARALQKFIQIEYGEYFSVYTLSTDLSRSFGLLQIMGQRAYELGWRGDSFYDMETGLFNVNIGLFYGAKLAYQNLERYNYDFTKAISAYNAGSYTARNSDYVSNVFKYMKRFEHDFDKFH